MKTSYGHDCPRNSRDRRFFGCGFKGKSIVRMRLSYERIRIATIGILALCCWSRSATIEGFSTNSRSRRIVQVPTFTLLTKNVNDDEKVMHNDPETSSNHHSRRMVLQGLLTATAAVPLAVVAAVPEFDSTGNLFTPKSEMLRGGSEAARGISVSKSGSRTLLKPGQALQSVYDTRFITYLSRFLINFDPAAHAWWIKQGLGDSWEEREDADRDFVEATFASFAESVEVGLADYFVGPYGSYSSVSAAKAGLMASQPAPSRPSESSKEPSLIVKLIFGQRKVSDKKASADSVDLAKNGILNLYALLKARYNSVAAKRQLAILFSFVTSPKLQPTNEIRGLLGEADNATVTKIQIERPSMSINEADSRTSSGRCGGYSLDSFPDVTIEEPPALGDIYRPAVINPVMRTTSRLLCITVVDGGSGYTSAPQVNIIQSVPQRQCQTAAILDRRGSVESIIVLDPGYGYGGRNPPTVLIDAPPKKKGTDPKTLRRAKATAKLEYEIVGVTILSGGNGYASTEPPKIKIPEPEEAPDWFLALQEQPELRMVSVAQPERVSATVAEMRLPDGNIAFSIAGIPSGAKVDQSLIDRLQRDPLEMLPSAVRPVLRIDPFSGKMIYTVRSLEQIPQFVAVMSPRYRAYDPVFGGVGTVPVTKGAISLKASEYGRLALSGALCTVAVRTLLNPLELIKTKQQLQNDDELNQFARDRLSRKNSSSSPGSNNAQTVAPSVDKRKTTSQASAKMAVSDASQVAVATEAAVATATAVIADEPQKTSETQVKIGTVDMIKSLIELRGPKSLFQSADITFLASLVFGSLGFGATELFRRSFTASFSNDGTGSESILLVAAALATVVTAAAASPFEVLRVRSMGLLEAQSWISVLEDFLEDASPTANVKGEEGEETEFNLLQLNPRDLLPLWSGFAPTLSRELPFAVTKFLVFDIISNIVVNLLNSRAGEGALPVQVGVGPVGLVVSASAGALAGIAGALVSHPADLILTYTSARKKKKPAAAPVGEYGEITESLSTTETEKASPEWLEVVKELISRDGGLANLFIGLPARSIFFFLVIGLQFFLYDYVKGLFEVGSDDLSLVLDVFYSVRAGLIGMDSAI